MFLFPDEEGGVRIYPGAQALFREGHHDGFERMGADQLVLSLLIYIGSHKCQTGIVPDGLLGRGGKGG